MIEALQDDVIANPEMKTQYLTTIHKEIQRLSGLVNDLFDLSKLELGQEDFYPIFTHMDRILLEVLDSYSILLEEKEIHLQLQVSDTLPKLWIMPCKIARVINNLLHNAIRYSPVSGTIELIVEENKQKHHVPFIVRDEGESIAYSDQLCAFLEQIYQEAHNLGNLDSDYPLYNH